MIADHLTRAGIAVLRYDDRGVGASTGDFAAATTADFTSDARAAFNFLKSQESIAPGKIGLLGHSEGGMVAPMVAADESDIAFLVLLAAPGVPIDSLLLMQSRMIGQASGQSAEQLHATDQLNRQVYDLLITENAKDELEQKLRETLSPLFDQQVINGTMTQEQAAAAITQQLTQLTSPWMRYFLKFDPDAYLRQVTCPVLALNGSQDLQVAAKENLAGIQRSLQANGNSRVTAKELPGLNHLFQESSTGLPSEYGTITQTLSPAVLSEISHWILQQE